MVVSGIYIQSTHYCYLSSMEKLTVIIPCKDEADNMEEVLASVQWADEILVVDSFSTDDTLAIARKYTDRILEHEYENSAAQKNWAIPQATHNWILLVDADERVTPELHKEIEEMLKSGELGFLRTRRLQEILQ